MLELRVYGKTELSEMFGTAGMQALQRKMERYGIAFEVNGRGENAVFTIKEIEDPFKIYCITELDFDGRTDFVKVRNFLHYFFNDDEFMAMYEQYEVFDDLEEEFMEMEEFVTAKLAEYVDEHLEYFAEIV